MLPVPIVAAERGHERLERRQRAGAAAGCAARTNARSASPNRRTCTTP